MPGCQFSRHTRSSAQTQPAAQAPAIAGSYAGTLQAGEAQLHLVLHLSKNAKGVLDATLDSLDQAVYAIEATSVSLKGSILKLDVPSVGAHFEGRFPPTIRPSTERGRKETLRYRSYSTATRRICGV